MSGWNDEYDIKELMELKDIYLPEAHLDARKMADLAKAIYDEKIFENIGVPFCMTIEAEDMGSVVDFGNEIYEPHVIEYAFDNINDWEKIKDFKKEDSRSDIVIEAIKILKDEEKTPQLLEISQDLLALHHQ